MNEESCPHSIWEKIFDSDSAPGSVYACRECGAWRRLDIPERPGDSIDRDYTSIPYKQPIIIDPRGKRVK